MPYGAAGNPIVTKSDEPKAMTSQRDKLLAQLAEHQAKVLEIVRRAQPLMASDATPDPHLASRARWELTRVLGAYQVFKDYELFDPIIRDGPPERVRIAELMKAESLALGEEFRAYLARRVSLGVAADWAGRRPAACKLARRIEAHLSRERWVSESLLLPLRTEGPARPDLSLLNARP